MKVALIGSVSSSYVALDALIRGGVEVVAVLGVQSSRASVISDYRDLERLARRASIPYQPFVRVTQPAVNRFLRRHRPDLLWVIGLSQLVPPSLLALAGRGGVGFHPTPLPLGRGRAPVAWTILLDQPAAATLFCLTDEPDAGDIIAQRPVPVLPDDYSEDLIERTNRVLAGMILDLAPAIRHGELPRTSQDDTRATVYARRRPEDGLIDWSASTDRVYRLIRAAGRPYPGAFTYAGGVKLIIYRARPVSDRQIIGSAPSRPGTVIEHPDGILVTTADGAVRLYEIQADPADADGDPPELFSGMRLHRPAAGRSADRPQNKAGAQ